jgi:DNA-binding CsgD family transcriptional regulator
MMQVCLLGPRSDDNVGKHAALSLYRGVKGEPFSSENRRLLSRLSPHLTVAAKNYWAAHTLRLLSGAHQHALDTITSGVFAINHSGRIIFLNRLGEEMLRHLQWVRMAKGILEPLPDLIEADKVANALHRLAIGVGAAMLITDSKTGAQAHLSMSNVPEAAEVKDLLTAPASLVWITPVVPLRDVGEQMGRLFELTRAECRLVNHLVGTENLRQAAAALHISIHTARTQLKSIFQKTGRRNQSELLALATRVASLYALPLH